LGPTVSIDEARREVASVGDVAVSLPSLDDLIRTKRIAARPKDLEDIRLLRVLKERRS
jgi:hypothetical protein